MAKPAQPDLKKRVILAARAYGIHTVLFRNAVGERLGVNVTDMECLALLFHQGLSTPTELAHHTGLSSGATTAMLDRLERAGLVQRKPNPADRRGSLISLVPAGQQKVAPWFESVRKAQEQLLSGYSAGQLRLLSEFFERSASMWELEHRKLQRQPASR